MQKLKEMHLITSLSHHNCQASYMLALYLLITARHFFHPEIGPELPQLDHNSDIFAICLPAFNRGQHLHSSRRPSWVLLCHI